MHRPIFMGYIMYGYDNNLLFLWCYQGKCITVFQLTSSFLSILHTLPEPQLSRNARMLTSSLPPPPFEWCERNEGKSERRGNSWTLCWLCCRWKLSPLLHSVGLLCLSLYIQQCLSCSHWVCCWLALCFSQKYDSQVTTRANQLCWFKFLLWIHFCKG